MAEAPKCETCRFWSDKRRHASQIDETGECHRRAPLPVSPYLYYIAAAVSESDSVGLVTAQEWPHTAYDDFCGEHQPANATGSET